MLGFGKKHIPILLCVLAGIFIFGYKFMFPINYEFLIYISVIIIFLFIILFTHKKVNYPLTLLWLLTIWAIFHMAGGAITIGNHILYEQILIPIINNGEWKILRFDQFIHVFGFFTTTILAFIIIKNQLKTPKLTFSLGLILVMAGCGFGAFNEIIEFIVDSSLPESGVGGYINTGLDLISNLIGSLFALIFIKLFLEE